MTKLALVTVFGINERRKLEVHSADAGDRANCRSDLFGTPSNTITLTVTDANNQTSTAQGLVALTFQ
ncbi:MAG: hypothetical protein LAO06_00650 [Acidobacteriia bacterium]|nr:hypothetical protein [Terriglobia bacterium]